MSKALKSGQWCKPRNEQEWKAILDLAGVLGVYAEPHDALYDNYPCVWSNGSGRVSQCRNEPCHKTCLVSVPDFLAGMYATAKETNIAPAEAEADLRRRLKFMEDTIASLDASPDELVGVRQLRLQRSSLGITDINTRLSKLEAAFNEHLVKERENKSRIKRHRLFLRNDPLIMKEVMKLSGWDMVIDTKASPKDIPFEVALAYLKAGRKVTQAHWDDDTYLTVEHGCIIVSTVRCRAFDSPDDAMKAILANDWLVLPE